MAINLGTLRAIIGADASQFHRAMLGVKRRLKESNVDFAKAGAGTAIASGAMFAAISGGVAASVGKFADFERSMTRVAAISAGGGQSISEVYGQLQVAARDLAAKTEHSASKIAGGFQFLAQAGFDAEKQIAAMPAVANLASVAMMEVADAADITTNIMSGMNVPIEKLNDTMDMLVNASTSANTSIPQLGEAFKYAGPMASAAGIGIGELTAMMAKLGDSGIQASMAGTGVSIAMQRILNPGKKAAGVMKSLGISFDAAEDGSRSLIPVIDALAKSENMARDASILFGARGAKAMIKLAQTGGSALREYQAEVSKTGSVQGIMAEMQKTGSFTFATLGSKVEEVAIALGSAMAPAIVTVSSAAGDLIDLFNGLDESTKETIGDVVLVTGAVVGVTAAVAALTVGMGALGLASAPVWISIAALAAGAALAMGTFDISVSDVVKSFKKLGVMIGFIATEVGDMLSGDFSGSKQGERLEIARQQMKEIDTGTSQKSSASGLVESVKRQMSELAAIKDEQFAVEKKGSQEIADKASEATADVMDDWADIGNSLGRLIDDGLSESGSAINDFTDKLVSESSDSYDRQIDAIGRVAEKLDAISSDASNYFEGTLKPRILANAEAIADSLGEAGNGMVEAIRKKIQDGGGASGGGGGIDPNVAAGAGVAGSMFQSGVEGAGSFGDVFKGGVQGAAAGGPIGAIMGAIMALVMKLEPVQKAFDQMGEGMDIIIEALNPIFKFLQPMNDALNEVLKAFLDGMEPILSMLGPILTKVFQPLTRFAMNFARILGQVFDALEPLLEVLMELVLEIVTALDSIDVLPEIMGAFAEVIKVFADMVNTVVDVIDDVLGVFGIDLKARIAQREKIREWELEMEAKQQKMLSDLETEYEGPRQDHFYFHPSDEATDAMGDVTDEMENMAATMAEVNDELRNVPSGFKVALAAFRATDAEGPGAGGGGNPATVNNISITATDHSSIFRSMREMGVEESIAQGGTSVGVGSQFSTPSEGA